VNPHTAMKSSFLLLIAGIFLTQLVSASPSSREQALLGILSSDPGLESRSAACDDLRRIGTSSAVPALTVLLNDHHLSAPARSALEAIPGPEATKALVSALPTTWGVMKAGLIDSLGTRGDPSAASALAACLTDDDPMITQAAASALGRIGSPRALKELKTTVQKAAPGDFRNALLDAVLACGDRALENRDLPMALKTFEWVRQRETQEPFRSAAFASMVRSSPGKRGLTLLNSALTGSNPAEQAAAISLVSSFGDADTTLAFGKLLPELPPGVQAPMIENLRQRGDTNAVPSLLLTLQTGDQRVRLASINALGWLGDGSVVRALAAIAAQAAGEEKQAAREALAGLRYGTPTEAFAAELRKSSGLVRLELGRAAGDRGDFRLLKDLVALAGQLHHGERAEILDAATKLARQEDLPALVQLVLDSRDKESMEQAADAVGTACQRILSRRGSMDPTPLLDAYNNSPKEVRIALLPAFAGLTGSQIAEVLARESANPDLQVQKAAIRAATSSNDPRLLPLLVKLATNGSDQTIRRLAFNSCVRLARQEDVDPAERMEVLTTLPANLPEEKRQILSALAEIESPEALAVAMSMIEDPSVREEAMRAALKIACAMDPADARAVDTLRKVRELAPEGAFKQEATTALNEVELRAEYITAWEAAGPYRKVGKNYAALFDLPFPPETRENSAVQWRALPARTDPQRPVVMDLLRFTAGESMVAYARTFLHADMGQPAVLEIGSDDGVKVWLNEELVHAHNTARALKAGSDKVTVNLRAGWNELLLKVTQNVMGWEFCVRVAKPDGTKLEGLRFSTRPNPNQD
jgi:HEAT repeat protein